MQVCNNKESCIIWGQFKPYHSMFQYEIKSVNVEPYSKYKNILTKWHSCWYMEYHWTFRLFSEVFSDKYLYRIALQISTDLSAIFLNLGINQAQLDAINYSHRTDINRQALVALIKWKDQTDRKTNDSESMFSTLNGAFMEAKRQDLVDFVNRLRGMWKVSS